MCIDIHTVAVIQTEEAYENLANSFKSKVGEINYMVKKPMLTIDEQSYLRCDYKVCNI